MAELISEAQIAARWPTLYDWTRGETVSAPDLLVDLRDVIAYLGGSE